LSSMLGIAVMFSSCKKEDDSAIRVAVEGDKSIVILYESDVHCGIDAYPYFAGYRDMIEYYDTAYAVLVSSGDYIQGADVGIVSKGSGIIDILNSAAYGVVALGNHEFDYGFPNLENIIDKFNGKVVCCNLTREGSSEALCSPYVIKQFGNRKIAFVGVTTNESENSHFYDEESGKKIITLHTDDEIVNMVQSAVNGAIKEGASFVIVLAHMGAEDSKVDTDTHPFNSSMLARKTYGIDAILDGHTHDTVRCKKVENAQGRTVIISEAGTHTPVLGDDSELRTMGKLVITKDGNLYSELIPTSELKNYSSSEVYATTLKTQAFVKVASTELCGYTMVGKLYGDKTKLRSTDLTKDNYCLAELVADAYQYAGEDEATDVYAIFNAGSIRDGLVVNVDGADYTTPKEITYGDLLGVNPYCNSMYLITIKGKLLKDYIKSTVKVKGSTFASNFTFVSKNLCYTVNADNTFGKLYYATESGTNVTQNGEVGDNDNVNVVVSSYVKSEISKQGSIDGEMDLGITDVDCIKNYINKLSNHTIVKADYGQSRKRIRNSF